MTISFELFRRVTVILASLLAFSFPVRAAGDCNLSIKQTSVTAYKLTIRVPTGKAVQGDQFDVECSGACEVEYLVGGSTPTTAVTNPTNANTGGACTTSLYAGSDSTGGVRLSLRALFSSGLLPLDWSRRQYTSGQQLTISVTAGSAVTVYINGSLRELR